MPLISQKTFISKSINRRSAILIHQGFNGLAVVIGIYLAWRVGNYRLAMINPIVAALLWFYSTGYKKQPFIGNFTVAFLSGLVVLVVVFFNNHCFIQRMILN